MTRYARYLVALALSAMLAACGLKESYNVSEDAAAKFHAALSAGKYDEIWNTVAPERQERTDQAKLTALLDAINRKLGKVTAVKQTNWSSNTDNGVSTVTMKYDTTFEHGSAKETLVFLWVTDKSLKLSDYAIDSPDMLIR
jgi:Protein of unknown function (DUF3887)/Protein of unknown function (DUF4019)